MYWIDGVLYKKLPLLNRIIQFGDGFFTTAKLKNNKILLLDWHIERLAISAKRLLFDTLDLSLLRQEMQMIANHYVNGLLKVIICRSNKENRGYGFNSKNSPIRVIVYDQIPKHYDAVWLKNGIKLIVSPIRLSRNVLFSGIKHLNRLEQIIIDEYCDKSIGDMALVLDTEDNIIECCSANIFWRRGMKVFTPALTHAGVEGVMRRKILSILPTLGYKYREVMVGIEDIYKANEVFITNSLLPIISVNSIEQYIYLSKKLFNILLSHVSNE